MFKFYRYPTFATSKDYGCTVTDLMYLVTNDRFLMTNDGYQTPHHGLSLSQLNMQVS